MESTGQLTEVLPRPSRVALRAPRVLLALVLIGASVAAVLGAGGPGKLSPVSADDPGSESAQTRALLGAATGVDPDIGLIVLVRTPAGVGDPSARARVQAVERVLAGERLVADVRSWYRARDPALVAADGRATYVVGGLRPVAIERTLDAARSVRRDVEAIPGVLLGGRAAFYADSNDIVREDLADAALLALPLLVVLMLWVFRGLVAALLPLLVGAITVAGALGALRVFALMGEVSILALAIVPALGLGLAVNHTLLVLSRYREEALAAGYGRRALRRALARAGPTVMCSSLTVAAGAAALLVFPQPSVRSIAVATVVVALLAGLAALTVLAAALAVLGRRVEALSLPRWREAAQRAARPADRGLWCRLSEVVVRRPRAVAAVTGALLLVLAFPALDIRTTAVDASVLPATSSSRQVAEAFAREGRTQPILVAAQPPAGTGAAELTRLAEHIERQPGIADVSPPQMLRRTTSGRDLWRLEALPGAAPPARRSQQAVRAVRALQPGFPVSVGGETAELVDLRDGLSERLPLALVLLLALTFAPIFALTRSLVLAVKAILMSALTVLATFGVLVLVFQAGRLEALLGYTGSGALEASVLVAIFVIAFGLATHYGMVLVSRVKEHSDRGAPDPEAVAMGLERTGRVITAGALLLCVALGFLVTAQHALIKQVGFGGALAVAIDATLVRALLAPSIMRVLGRWNWWSPRWLYTLTARPRRTPPPSTLSLGPGPEYLAVSRHCDWRNPAVYAALAQALEGDEADRTAAVKLFRFVRDEVAYEFGPWTLSASSALQGRRGTGSTKANLLVALLRAAGIPAAYGSLRLDAQRHLGPIAPAFLIHTLPRDSTHLYAAAYLDGQWVRCDPSTDRQLASATIHWSTQTRLIDWDGAHDAMDSLDPAHVHADLGLQPDLDDLLAEPPANPRADLLERGNDYLAFAREHPPFESADQLMDAYARGKS